MSKHTPDVPEPFSGGEKAYIIGPRSALAHMRLYLYVALLAVLFCYSSRSLFLYNCQHFVSLPRSNWGTFFIPFVQLSKR